MGRDLKQANLAILFLVEIFLGYIVNNVVYGKRDWGEWIDEIF